MRRDRVKLERAKQLRSSMTPAEECLWRVLRTNQTGFHFRRQDVIGPFIADFYCRNARVAVEVDGGIHEQQVEADRERDQFFNARSIVVLRFRNDSVLNDLASVCERIRMTCASQLT